jgi:hypothetical protein
MRMSLFRRLFHPQRPPARVRPPLRWDAAEEFDVAWKQRIAEMASFIDGPGRVADFGCGLMWLEQYLSVEQTYVPIDFVRRDARTMVVDFNAGPLPRIDADVAFLSGILEYVRAPLPFLAQLSSMGFRQVILSYNTIEQMPDLSERRFLGWANDLSLIDVQSCFSPRYDLTHLTRRADTIFVFQARRP